MIPTTVGNYPKVAEGAYGTGVIGAISRWQRKELSDAQLEETFRDVTRAVIKEQEDAGLQILTDGQIRWEDLVTPIARKLDGFEIGGLQRFFNNNVYYRRPILHKAPKRRGDILVSDWKFAASCTRRPVKAVLPGPYTFALMAEDRHFKSVRKFALAMAAILNAEAKALAKAGAPWIQFDEPAIGFGKTDVKLAVEALNAAAAGVDATTGVATYFGALNGAFEALQRSKVDAVSIDVVSDPKALGALKRAKLAKTLGLGCLDARNTKLESVTELHALFDVVGRRVPLAQVHVHPSCGLEFLPHAQALAKLRRLGEAVKTYKPSRKGA